MLASEVDQLMHEFHYSVEMGSHCGRDSMLHKISMIYNYIYYLLFIYLLFIPFYLIKYFFIIIFFAIFNL